MTAPTNNDAALVRAVLEPIQAVTPTETRIALAALARLAATAERADEAERMIALCKTLLRQFRHSASDEPLDVTVTTALDSFSFQKRRADELEGIQTESDEWEARHETAVAALLAAQQERDRSRRTAEGLDAQLVELTARVVEVEATITRLRDIFRPLTVSFDGSVDIPGEVVDQIRVALAQDAEQENA